MRSPKHPCSDNCDIPGLRSVSSWQLRQPAYRYGYGVVTGKGQVLTTENLIRNSRLVEVRRLARAQRPKQPSKSQIAKSTLHCLRSRKSSKRQVSRPPNLEIASQGMTNPLSCNSTKPARSSGEMQSPPDRYGLLLRLPMHPSRTAFSRISTSMVKAPSFPEQQARRAHD